VQVELGAIAARFLGRGSPQIVADDMTRMIDAQNTGIYDVDTATASSTRTSFPTWVETVFKPAFDAAV
jgi:hypothetical protein